MSTGTRLTPISIDGPAGPLEALLQEHAGVRCDVTALICHPHPLYGGTLHNKVVHRAASALHAVGAAVLRFNFRGVGESAGRFDQGEGELEDARAAMAFLAARHPRARRWIAGFSFGSWIAANLAASDAGIEQLILIAPPVRSGGFDAMRTASVPKLVVQGTADETCPIEFLDQQFPGWAGPKTLIRIEGAGHFFDRQLGALAEAITRELAGAAQRSAR
ncbi:MAG: alpha/beta hydrolase [Candidatus Eisenbacteria bacterium]|nr:alpha/beta hydrolase [Candidatus Eisenbacteria bacterium]